MKVEINNLRKTIKDTEELDVVSKSQAEETITKQKCEIMQLTEAMKTLETAKDLTDIRINELMQELRDTIYKSKEDKQKFEIIANTFKAEKEKLEIKLDLLTEDYN